MPQPGFALGLQPREEKSMYIWGGRAGCGEIGFGEEVEKNPLRNSTTDGFWESMIIVVRESTGE